MIVYILKGGIFPPLFLSDYIEGAVGDAVPYILFYHRLLCYDIDFFIFYCYNKLINKTKVIGGKIMDSRFEFTEKKGFMEGARVIVDKETGVQYLLAHWTNVGGLTVLVDKDGKPLLDPKYAK